MVEFELFYGAFKSSRYRINLEQQRNFLSNFESLLFDNLAVLAAGRIYAQLERIGNPIGVPDVLIAAIALTNNLTLVTHNTNHFQRIDDLTIEDWEID